MLRVHLSCCCVLWIAVGRAGAAPPGINLLQPPLLQAGAETRLRILGQDLDKDAVLILPFPAETKLLSAGPAHAVFAVKPAKEVAPSIYPIRVRTVQGLSNLRLVSVSTLPVVAEHEPNNRWTEAKKATPLPAIFTGELSHPATDVDAFRFFAKAGARFTLATETRRLGLSPDLLLRLRDAKGRELAYGNNTPGYRADELLDFTFKEDGDYIVEVHNAAFNNTAWTNLYTVKVGDLNYAKIVFPLGGKRGAKTRFTAYDRAGKPSTIDATLPADPWLADWRLPLPEHPGSMAWPLALGDFPEHFEDDLSATAAPKDVPLLPWPCTLNGRIAAPDEEDHFRLTVRPGQRLRVAAEAYYLGSPLDGHLIVYDPAAKKVLAQNNDREYRGNPDPGLEFTVPDGVREVIVLLQDSFRRGGLAFAYRLTVEAGGPDFYLALGHETFRPLNTRERLHDHADTLNLPLGKEAKLPLNVRRSAKEAPHFNGPDEGYQGPIRLQALGLPPGVRVKESVIPAGATAGELVFVADAVAPREPFEITIVGEGTRPDGTTIVRIAERRLYLCEPANTHLPWNWRSRRLVCLVLGGN